MVAGPQLVELTREGKYNSVLEHLVDNEQVDPIHIAAILGTAYVRHDVDVIDLSFNRSVIGRTGYDQFNPTKPRTKHDVRVSRLLHAKFSGEAWTGDTIRGLVEDYVANRGITDEHMAALLGAIMVKDLNKEETIALTEAYRDSGIILEINSQNITDKIIVDKHSFGGIGDCVSLVLAPLLAAASDDIRVPMMSGRGLGHTGGTLDKLEAIPGYDVNLSPQDIHRIVNEVGCAIFAQTDEITPADGRIYRLRDLTNCVMNGGLITASILGKKLAEGLDILVLDVKTGSGAFYTDEQAAREIGQFMCDVGTANGTHTTAVVTDMNQPLAPAAGNLLEVVYSAQALKGQQEDSRFMDVVYTLAENILTRSEVKVPEEFNSMRHYLRCLIRTEQAYGKFLEMVKAQGGDPNYVERVSEIKFDCLNIDGIASDLDPSGNLQVYNVRAPKSGFVTSMQLTQIGEYIRDLGAGRQKEEDEIDPFVGVYFQVKLGDDVIAEENILAYVFHDGKTGNPEKLAEYFTISPTQEKPPELIKHVITPTTN